MKYSDHWAHSDRVSAIRHVEEKDIAYLVQRGVAVPVPSSLNGHGDELARAWGLEEASRKSSKCYDIFLSPALGPLKVRRKVRLRFWYDLTRDTASIRIRQDDFDKLYDALFPPSQGGRKAMTTVWGFNSEPWVVRHTP